MVKDSCIINPQNMQELENIAKNDDMVLFIHSHGCPHCKETKPVLEQTCQQNDSDLKFVECPVEKDHCRAIAQAAKVEGVPVTMAIPHGKGIQDPDWKVVGSRKKEIVGNVKQSIKKNKSKGAGNRRETAKRGRPQRSPSRPSPQQVQPRQRAPGGGQPSHLPMDSAIAQMIGQSPQAPVPPPSPDEPKNFNFDTPEYVEMCVPGKDCTHDEFDERFVDFYTMDFDASGYY